MYRIAALEKRPDGSPNDKSEFTLRCELDNNQKWTCEMDLTVFSLTNFGNWSEDLPSVSMIPLYIFVVEQLTILMFTQLRIL